MGVCGWVDVCVWVGGCVVSDFVICGGVCVGWFKSAVFNPLFSRETL